MPAMPSLSAPTSIPTLLDPANFDTDSEYFWSTYWPLFSDWVTDFKSWADTNTFTDITANGYGATTLPVVPGGSIDATNIPSGNYRTTSGDSGTFPSSADFGILEVLPRSTTSQGLRQRWHDWTPQRNYFRWWDGSAWSRWYEEYTQFSAVGTVSMSSGVPTGAIIETGSGANGRYVRFADGMQVCHHVLASSSSAAVTWTFPAAFSAAPQAFVQARSASAVIANIDAVATTTAVTFSIWSTGGARQNAINGELFSIGRWV